MKTPSLHLVGLLATIVGLLVVPLQGQGYNESCTIGGAYFSEKKFLGMFCQNNLKGIHGYNWTWIDLDWCLQNDGGTLQPTKFGAFSSSCITCDFDMKSKGGDLKCSCSDAMGVSHDSTVDLNKIIWVDDGAMGCFDKIGNKSWTGPTRCQTC